VVTFQSQKGSARKKVWETLIETINYSLRLILEKCGDQEVGGQKEVNGNGKCWRGGGECVQVSICLNVLFRQKLTAYN